MTMKKIILILLAVTVMLVVGVAIAWPARANTNPVVFFVPHQDDETLTMGADIVASNLAGRPVVIVTVTDGSMSNAFVTMCERTYHRVCFADRAAFGRSRDNEQVYALKALMPNGNFTVFHEGYLDGTLTQAQAEATILKYVALYPTASFKTMSWLDASPDHANLGLALRNLCNAGSIPAGDCRFEQFRPYWTTMPIAGWFIAGSTPVINAYDAYGVWDTAHYRYGIGQSSVPNDFAAARLDPRTKVHLK